MKKIFYFIYFLLPFLVWFFIYLQKPDVIILFKRPIGENSVIIPIQDLWKVILVFFVFQLGNEILAHLIINKIFVKINLFFILFHFLVAFYLLICNFF